MSGGSKLDWTRTSTRTVTRSWKVPEVIGSGEGDLAVNFTC
jgi:hypothetical protein